MSRLKLHSSFSSPAVWLWSLAFVLPPALAAIAASEPAHSVSNDSAMAAPTIALASAQDARPDELPVRTARRVLIDGPGDDALSTVTTDAWLIVPDSGDVSDAAEAVEIEDTEPAATTEKIAEPASEEPAAISPELSALCDKVRRALANYYPRHYSARNNNPWEVMHAIIAYGVDTQLFKQAPGGEKVNAIGWMCYNYPCAGQRLLFLNGGQVDAGRGVGVQGHGGQFLAILAQSRVMADYPLRVEGKMFTLADLIEREKNSCVAGDELTFKLIALAHYLDSDATWKTPDGQDWSIQRLIREEIKAPIRGAACGGSHRLMGFSYALQQRAKDGKPIDGEFRRAEIYTKDYHRYTFSLQNPDGSFSTSWFEGRGSDPSVDRRLRTTGHITEWITFSLSDDELRDPRMIKAVDYLATILLNNQRHTWEIGPLGHALHALALYDNRVFKDVVPLPQSPLAGDSKAARAARLSGETAQ